VAAYERASLHGGDITRDFLRRAAPAAADVLKDSDFLQSNQTISAEGMDVLHRYRAFNHPDRDGQFTPDTGEIIRQIAGVEAGLGGFTRPVAHGSVRDYLDNSCVDLLWLRERFGVDFPGVDYSRISGGHAPPAPPQRVSDICALDEEKRDRLMMTVMNRLSEKATKGRKMKFKAAMPRFGGGRKK
jgi:hypothetical protein